jgi:hypothetical protein
MDWLNRLCHGDTVPTLFFGPIHRLVGGSAKCIQGIAMVGKDRHTDKK